MTLEELENKIKKILAENGSTFQTDLQDFVKEDAAKGTLGKTITRMVSDGKILQQNHGKRVYYYPSKPNQETKDFCKSVEDIRKKLDNYEHDFPSYPTDLQLLIHEKFSDITAQFEFINNLVDYYLHWDERIISEYKKSCESIYTSLRKQETIDGDVKRLVYEYVNNTQELFLQIIIQQAKLKVQRRASGNRRNIPDTIKTFEYMHKKLFSHVEKLLHFLDQMKNKQMEEKIAYRNELEPSLYYINYVRENFLRTVKSLENNIKRYVEQYDNTETFDYVNTLKTLCADIKSKIDSTEEEISKIFKTEMERKLNIKMKELTDEFTKIKSQFENLNDSHANLTGK